MIAVDTNVLVYAHRKDSRHHNKAFSWIKHLAEGSKPWAVPVFCVGEFLRVVTHRRLFANPSTHKQAFEALGVLLDSPGARVLNPSGSFYFLLKDAILESKATGNLVFDAQIAALCREHGIRQLLTEDRDFSRFSSVSIVSVEEDPNQF